MSRNDLLRHHFSADRSLSAGQKLVVLLLISAEEAADGEQDEGCDGEIVDRQSDCPGAFRKDLLDSDCIQQNVDQKPVAADDERAKNGGADATKATPNASFGASFALHSSVPMVTKPQK